MTNELVDRLQSLVSQLQSKRQALVGAIAEIDKTFAALGLSVDMKARVPRAVPAKTTAKKTIKRRKFKTTANELILATIKKAGAKGVTGAQLSRVWKANKRSGEVYKQLGPLVQAKKIKRQNIRGGRGSVYTL